jgi:hypothetical protein
MMAKANIFVKFDAFDAKMQKIMSRARDLSSYFDTVVFRQYQNAQKKRFMTENASEGAPWAALNSKYAVGKLKMYKRFPGGGRRMLIATNALSNAVTGSDPTLSRKLAEPRRLTIGIDAQAVADMREKLMGQVVSRRPSKKPKKDAKTYAQWVNEKRPFMNFGATTRMQIRQGLRAFILSGKVPGGIFG